MAESILSFFPGFEAFTLPSPTVDPEMMRCINDNRDDINPLFFSGLEEFKRLLWNVLVPKNSFNAGEVVTGEGEYGRSQELRLFYGPHCSPTYAADITPVLFNKLRSVLVRYRL